MCVCVCVCVSFKKFKISPKNIFWWQQTAIS